MNAIRIGRVVGWVGLAWAVGAWSAAGAQKADSLTTAPQSMTVANKRYDAEKELARMARAYKLTDEQRVKLQPILLEQQKKIHTLGEDTTLSDAEWSGGVREIHAAAVAKLKLLLTEDQATKYAKDEAKLAKKSESDSDNSDEGPPGGPPPGGGGPGGGGPPM